MDLIRKGMIQFRREISLRTIRIVSAVFALQRVDATLLCSRSGQREMVIDEEMEPLVLLSLTSEEQMQ